MTQAYKLIADAKPAVDQRWFGRLLEIDSTTPVIGLSREMFTVLGPDHDDLEKLRSAFEKQPFNPDLRHHGFDTDGLVQPLAALRQLRRQIEDEETNKAVKRTYLAKIDEVIINNQLLIASVTDDRAGFAAANHALYGQPNERLFRAECAWLRKYAKSYSNSTNEHIRHCAEAVLKTLPQLRGQSKDLFPGNAVFRRVRQLHYASNGYFEQLLGNTPLPEQVTTESGDTVVRNAIRTVGADYAVADSSDELWGVIHHVRQVVRPADFKLPREDFIGIVAHEVGSHLLERCNGKRQALRLLEIGLDRYEAGNEGRAFLREQLVYASPYDMQHQPGFEYIVLKHLSISLGHGLHKKPYTFRELYDTMLPVCRFFQILRQPDNPVYAEAIACSETWHLLVRVLKGTNGTGGAYLKDIVYLEGNVRAWRAARRNPAIILFGDNGKFDIARADHLAALAAFGLRPVPRLPFRLPIGRLTHALRP